MTRASQRIARAAACLVVIAACALSSTAHAQRFLQYDTFTEGASGTVFCGLCAGEKFGVVFYDFPADPAHSVSASDFPLTLTTVQVALAAMEQTAVGSCVATSTLLSVVGVEIEVYAGTSVPTDISSMPSSGPWDATGEERVWAETVLVAPSMEDPPGSRMLAVQFNEFPTGEGIPVTAPAVYLRVVASMPAGGGGAGCTSASPVSALHDGSRVGPHREFLRSNEGTVGWFWNEDFATGINGDWAIRLTVRSGAVPTDGGVTPMTDSGVGPGVDGGTGASCTSDTMCAGGERCVAGHCVRQTCSTEADCGGGRTCVSGTCRSLCSSTSDCRGGEVCDTAMGYCTAAGATDDGCGCRIAGARRVRSGAGAGAGAIALAVLALSALARRRRRGAMGA